MPSSIDVHSGVRWAVHILVPYALLKDIDNDKDNLEDGGYYQFESPTGEPAVTEWTPSHRQEVERALGSLPEVWALHWRPIGLESLSQVLDSIVQFAKQDEQEFRLQMDDSHAALETVVLNLVDGMEVDKWPGVSVIRGLESRHLAFTGSDSLLFECDSDKARIKKHMIESGAPTPGYCDVYSAVMLEEEGARSYDEEADKQRILLELSRLQFPLLVKPANSSSSRGLSKKSVVDSPEEAYKQAMETKKIWGPVYVEEYISGREYTALVSGSADYGIDTYMVLERVFRDRIPERERMLTYDMKWGKDNYGSNQNIERTSWWMEVCPDDQQPYLQQKAREIYASFGGNGYCRMDLREDSRTGKLYVVDVNANCSVDESEDCAMGKILKASGLTLGLFFGKLISFAIRRRNGLYGNPTKSAIEGANIVADSVEATTESIFVSPQTTVHA